MSERAQHYRTAGKDDLTSRQREVLELVAAGKTNPEIAEKLGITLDGAKFHIREILAKLGVDSREEAAGWWKARRGRGTRVASVLRGLSLASIWKPAVAGTVLGGSALALAVVGFGMGGSSSGGGLPECEMTQLRGEAAELVSYRGTAYSLSLSADRPCELNGRGAVSIVAPQNGGTLATSAEWNATVELRQTPTWVATASWLNWCEDLQPQTVVQFNTREAADGPGGPSLASTLPITKAPACENGPGGTVLGISAHTTGETIIKIIEPDRACDTGQLRWSTRSVIDADPAIGLRYVLSAVAPEPCVLDAVIGVTGYGGHALQPQGTFLWRLGGPIAVTVEGQFVGSVETPVIVGRAANACNSGQQVVVVITTPEQSSYALDPPLPPCIDPALGPQFSAEWTANVAALTPRGETPWWGPQLISPAPAPPATTTPAGEVVFCDARYPTCVTPSAVVCGVPGCVVAAYLLANPGTWMASAAVRQLEPGQPPGIYVLETGERRVIGVSQLVADTFPLFGPGVKLVAVGDAQKYGILDLVFRSTTGRVFSIAVEPGVGNTYPPIGMTYWTDIPADDESAETSFGTALYRRVP